MIKLLKTLKPGESIEINCMKTGEFRVVAYTEKCSKGASFNYGDVIDSPDPSMVVQMLALSTLSKARDDEAKMGPIEKEPFIQFYLLPLVDKIRELGERVWHKITGAWWCEYCTRYHGRRTSHYKVMGPFVCADTCSRGKKAMEDKTWKPDDLLSMMINNLLGNKEVKAECKHTTRR